MGSLLCILSYQMSIMGGHGNGKNSYSPNEFFLEAIISLG